MPLSPAAERSFSKLAGALFTLLTSPIGVSLFGSTLLGWFLLRNLFEGVQELLFAIGAAECST